MRWRRGGYTIDTDRERLDLETITDWLNGTYWAAARPPEAIRRSWEAAGIVSGLYTDEGGALAGCARVTTDFVTIAYLSDVFVAPAHRGSGLGVWLVETIIGHPDLMGVGWLLHTRDAHGLYRRLGFVEIGPRLMERPRPASGVRRQ